MKQIKYLFIIIILSLCGCGKKTSLDRYPDSDYPKQYPKEK
jgi:predicted small lipoprotein YifL